VNGEVLTQQTDASILVDPIDDATANDDIHVAVKVTHRDDPLAVTHGALTLINTELPDFISGKDSDNDGILDAIEGLLDEDADGVPDYLDALSNKRFGSNVVIQSLDDEDLMYFIESEPGTNLAVADYGLNNKTHGALLNNVLKNKLFRNDSQDHEFENTGGLFGFIIRNIETAGQSIEVVIAQRQAIPKAAIYRKYDPISGLWYQFVENELNHLKTALGQPGSCPSPGSSEYKAGLTPGHWCIELTIEDGGPNDNDGNREKSSDADNMISDPGGIAVQATANHVPVANNDQALTIVKDIAATIGVLSNDTDEDEDVLSIIYANAMLGTINIVNQRLKYTPPINYMGNDVATYTISDGQGGLAKAQINIQVIENSVPTMRGIPAQSSYNDELLTIDVLAYVDDNEGDTLGIDSLHCHYGQCYINDDGTIDYKSRDDKNAYEDVITVVIKDSAEQRIKTEINVSVIIRPPVIKDITVTTSGGNLSVLILLLLLGLSYYKFREEQV